MVFVGIDIPRPQCGIQRNINRPQAGLGGNPIVPHMRETQSIMSQGAKRHLTDASAA